MHIEDVDKALYFHNLAGASIDRRMLAHAAKVCAGVELSDHVVRKRTSNHSSRTLVA